MSIVVIRTTYSGRTYDVVANSEQREAPFCNYVQIYRVRKDGSRGHRFIDGGITWRVWSVVRDRVNDEFDRRAAAEKK